MILSIRKKICSILKINEKNKLKYECIKICLIYLVIGFFWIYFSDRIANELISNKNMLTSMSTYKGWIYVIVTSIILYLLISTLLKKVDLTEKKLSKSEEKSRNIIKAMPDLLFVINHEGRFIDCQVNNEELLLMPKEAFIGKTIWQVIPKEIAKIGYEKMQLVLKSGGLQRFEYKLKVSDKEQYYELRMVRNSKREVLAISRNITVERQNELEVKRSEEKYKALVNQMQQGVALHEVILNKEEEVINYRFLEANESYEKLTGLKKKDILGKTVLEVLPDIENYWIEKFGHVAKTGEPLHYENYARELGRCYDVLAYRTKPLQFAVIVTDITERKQMEQKMEYLSYHDQLTGLYNRRFFEEELKRLDVEKNFPLTIVMADVNGLKLVNDSFGHDIGDELLKKVAEVMIKGCRDNDIVARLGGDEFMILLPKTDIYETEQIIKHIKDIALKEKVSSLDISVSFGYGTKKNEEEKIQEIFKKAEDYMYKKKLFESPSMRGKTISAIINTLYEKNKREEQHSHRVSALCVSMGNALGLPEGEIEELKTVGLLHDIGKIAIEENILNKQGKLTSDEWEEIKRHPEIGYRILNTVNDMSEMAEYILGHHERWNGMGYPKNLKGEEIPLQSRIIAILDSYDAMTSERSYRRALPEEAAIKELQINAGIQFDPELVRVFIEKVLNKSL